MLRQDGITGRCNRPAPPSAERTFRYTDDLKWIACWRFFRWVDSALKKSRPPSNIVAFNFNLYEGPFRADLVGATSYDPMDSDWATEEAWVAKPRFFDFPPHAWGSGWQDALAVATKLINDYLRTTSDGATRLGQAVAVTVGFVDGDLVLAHGGTV